jgi:hypothetical protein
MKCANVAKLHRKFGEPGAPLQDGRTRNFCFLWKSSRLPAMSKCSSSNELRALQVEVRVSHIWPESGQVWGTLWLAAG